MKTSILSLTAVSFFASTYALQAEDNKEEQMKAGQVAAATCLACHGPDGKGLPVGTMKMAPSLEGSAVVNGDPEVFARVVLKGIKKEGTAYVGMMTPLEASFTTDGSVDAAKLAAVMTYVRNSFGNSAAPVTTAQAKAAAEKFKDVKEPVTRAELDALTKKP